MAKQSAYLQRREAELNAVFWAGAAMAAQFVVFYFKSILTANIPLWLKLYLLGGK